MKLFLILMLLFVWFLAYYKYEADQNEGLRTGYVIFMRVLVAGLSGWTVGGIITNIISHY